VCDSWQYRSLLNIHLQQVNPLQNSITSIEDLSIPLSSVIDLIPFNTLSPDFSCTPPPPKYRLIDCMLSATQERYVAIHKGTTRQQRSFVIASWQKVKHGQGSNPQRQNLHSWMTTTAPHGSLQFLVWHWHLCSYNCTICSRSTAARSASAATTHSGNDAHYFEYV
jgi:hypothetical protein